MFEGGRLGEFFAFIKGSMQSFLENFSCETGAFFLEYYFFRDFIQF